MNEERKEETNVQAAAQLRPAEAPPPSLESIFNAEDPIACEWFEKYRSQSGRICVTY